MIGEESPDDRGEGCESDGAERCATGLERGGIAAAGRAVNAGGVLFFALVRGYQRGRSRKNRRKRLFSQPLSTQAFLRDFWAFRGV